MKLESIIKETIRVDYCNLGIKKILALPYKHETAPNHFSLEDSCNRKWFLKVREIESGNMLLLNELYEILCKNDFATLYPVKNKFNKYLTCKHSLLIQIFPFIRNDAAYFGNKSRKTIDLFSFFYNIANKKKFFQKPGKQRFKKYGKEVREVLADKIKKEKLKKFFPDFDNLLKRTAVYFKEYKQLKICHGDCGDKNLIFSGKKVFLIDFDDFGLNDLRWEIFRVASGLKDGKRKRIEEFIGYITRFNRRLEPRLRLSNKDLADLDLFFFLTVILRVKYKPVNEVLSAENKDFYWDIKNLALKKDIFNAAYQRG